MFNPRAEHLREKSNNQLNFRPDSRCIVSCLWGSYDTNRGLNHEATQQNRGEEGTLKSQISITRLQQTECCSFQARYPSLEGHYSQSYLGYYYDCTAVNEHGHDGISSSSH